MKFCSGNTVGLQPARCTGQYAMSDQEARSESLGFSGPGIVHPFLLSCVRQML